MAVFMGALLLGAGVQCAQIRLTAWFVRRKESRAAAVIMAIKAVLWVGLLAGGLLVSHLALLGSVAGCALFILGYAIAHYVSMRK